MLPVGKTHWYEHALQDQVLGAVRPAGSGATDRLLPTQLKSEKYKLQFHPVTLSPCSL